MKSVIVHYQEIALKGKNRPWFVARLVRNLREATKDLDVRGVRSLMGRVEVLLGPSADWDRVSDRLATVFGVGNFARASRVTVDPAAEPAAVFDAIAAEVLADLQGVDTPSFRVSARRADKRFPVPSPMIEREVGGRVKQAMGWRVDLSHPALTIRVEMLTSEAFYSFGKERGAGGLPVGASGRVVCLLSGGIDSPVAAWRMMRRGCRVTFVHFHSYPILSRASQEKARELARLLTRYQFQSRLFLVPFGEIQQQVVLTVPPPLRVVIYRRMMLRIAERVARQVRARGLVTGEVVGQVASQTLENLGTIGSVARMPVLRPLIGMDKEEITAQAERLGTYPISIIPDQDCCTLFTPRHPATKARVADVEAAEQTLAIDSMIDKAMAETAVEQFNFPTPPEPRGQAPEARGQVPEARGHVPDPTHER
ncbi:MAG TPA: tRNA uracil 4-sulfurtransferase ThiI [Vicinamibacterales bacterium]|nr:tRNA uracil 4-sulfurtransferase ThiI [Vicinamibacterales bacterium]